MLTKNFSELSIGDRFFKEGVWMVKTEPKRSGGCGCRIEANASIIDPNPTPLRLFADVEQVEVEGE